MSVRVVYSKSFGIRYKASVCSKAFVLYLVITLLTFTLPFLFCYRSNGESVFFSLVFSFCFLLLFRLQDCGSSMTSTGNSPAYGSKCSIYCTPRPPTRRIHWSVETSLRRSKLQDLVPP